jgi:hypothetical protein
MARKFFERENSTTLNAFDGPAELDKAVADARILELQDILSQPDYVKATMVAGVPGVQTEAEFNAFFEDELHTLGDQGDFYANETVTVPESFDAVDHRWMSPADLRLGPGTIQSVCGEEVGNEAIQAIDGVNNQNWQHDFDHVHDIIIDFGLIKRVNGIRFNLSAVPAGPLQLFDVQVFIAGTVAKLTDPASHVGVDLTITDGGDNDRNLTIRNGRFVQIQIGSTGHVSNHITIRDILFRMKPRTAFI